MLPGHLNLVPIYLGHQQGLCEPLASRLELSFAIPVRLHPPWFDPEECFDPGRSQYHSTRLLAQLMANAPWKDGGTTLGVASVDLFVPVLTYVFGEAQLGGKTALVSIHRLRPEAYGLPPDPGLLAERVAKEAIHELGHTFGLLHCQDPSCVMHPSTYAEEIDWKSDVFCPACRLRAAAPSAAGMSHLETRLPVQSALEAGRSTGTRLLSPRCR